MQGVVGRVTRLDGEGGGFDEAVLIQHSAFTAEGTSGSPIFDTHGRVVAINTGAYLDDDPASSRDARSIKPGPRLVTQALHGYNFGMRIDLALALLHEADE